MASINTGFNGLTKLRDWWSIVKTNFININTQMVNHVAGTADKHDAEDIDYSGSVSGSNVKQAVDNLKTDINNIAMTGSEHDALVTAALVDVEEDDFGPSGENTGLDGRLGKWEQRTIDSEAAHASHLAETAKIYINVLASIPPLNDIVGDGVSDDTNGINARINFLGGFGGGTLIFPRGTYCISDELYNYQIPVSFIGSGSGFSQFGENLATNLTTIKWIGTSGDGKAMLKFEACNYGIKVEGIQFDCNESADIGLYIDSCQGGDYRNITIINGPKVACMKIDASSMTCSWNDFQNIGLQNLYFPNTKGLWLTGVPGINPCHNTFINIKIDHADTDSHAIYMGHGDNNSFYDIYIYRSTGNGRGVYLDDSIEAGLPCTNVFFHLQAGAGGWYQMPGIGANPSTGKPNNTNMIFGYMKDNGQPDPIYADGALYWIDSNGADSSRQTYANITYYVNDSTGSDSNDGLTVGTPFKTIQHAVNKIPPIVNHIITINVAAGTYSGSFEIYGPTGSGEVRLYGSTDLAGSINYNIVAAAASKCSIPIKIRGVNFTRSTGTIVSFDTMAYCEIYYCKLTGGGNNGILANAADVYAHENEISNVNYAYNVAYGVLVSENTTGTSNNYLRAVYGGTIAKSGTQPAGTEQATLGGRIA